MNIRVYCKKSVYADWLYLLKTADHPSHIFERPISRLFTETRIYHASLTNGGGVSAVDDEGNDYELLHSQNREWFETHFTVIGH